MAKFRRACRLHPQSWSGSLLLRADIMLQTLTSRRTRLQLHTFSPSPRSAEDPSQSQTFGWTACSQTSDSSVSLSAWGVVLKQIVEVLPLTGLHPTSWRFQHQHACIFRCCPDSCSARSHSQMHQSKSAVLNTFDCMNRIG